jgi:hypothetical protein
MKTVRPWLIERIWKGRDPLADFPAERYTVDTQGWNSDHPYLTEAIDTLRPRVIVEVGVWKGGSVLTMAKRLRELDLDAAVIAVDTWLGSVELWLQDEWFQALRFVEGYPTLVKTFLTNVVKLGLADYVVPLPLDSLNAARLLHTLGIRPGLVHIDGGHEEEVVAAGLRLWWELLEPGGMLIGDDYPDWEGVRRAFDRFFSERNLFPFVYGGNKCRIQKPR